ncbi:MAG: hypothetical protein NUK62_05730 [Tenericutes bacterium]|nr:hypothetical protein [Mycoplasmatota bacterium]
MEIFFGCILIFLGIAIIAKPDTFLHIEDLIRLKGERTYSDAAIILMRFSGGVTIIVGIVFIFIGV